MTLYDGRKWLVGMGFLLVAVLPGCGKSMRDPSDPDKAKAALVTALEAWQNGADLETLHQRTPPIFFNDAKAGSKRLSSFQLEENHGVHGLSVRIPVKLTFVNGGGKERTAHYLVDTAPHAVVIVPD